MDDSKYKIFQVKIGPYTWITSFYIKKLTPLDICQYQIIAKNTMGADLKKHKITGMFFVVKN